MELHEKLIQLREEKGLSQLKVAEILDVSRQAVSKWEVGTALPSTKNLCGLRELYGVSMDYLVGDGDMEKPPAGSVGTAPAGPEDGEGERTGRGLERVGLGKRLALFGLVPILLLIVTAAAVFWRGNNRAVYPGGGVYDVTKYTPYHTAGTAAADEIEMLGLDFKTNSTKISVYNAGEREVTVYLYDRENPTSDYIRVMTLEPAERERFTMLEEARQYQIGVESLSAEYALKISD